MPRFLRRLVTLVLVVVFTLFFASDDRSWVWLGQDLKTGDVYYYDARGLRSGPNGLYRLSIKMVRPRGPAVVELYELDAPHNTMRNLTYKGPAQPILPGTPGANLTAQLRGRH